MTGVSSAGFAICRTVTWLKQTIGHLTESDELPGRGAGDVDRTEKHLFGTLLDVRISHHGAPLWRWYN